MKYEVIYKCAYAIVVDANSATEAFEIADGYDNNKIKFIDYPPEVHKVNEK